MSKGGGSTTQTTQVKLPEWVNAAGKENLALAKEISQRPYTPYTGQRIAGFNAIQQDAMQRQLDFANAGVGQPALNTAMTTAGNVAGYAPASVVANVGNYMNPFLQQVGGNLVSDLDRTRQLAQMGNAADAVRNKAFGGSRQAVAESLTNSEFFRNANNALTNLYAGGFDRATALAGQDIGNQISAGGLNLNAANQLANMGGMQRQWGAADIALANEVGQRQQAMDQAMNDLAYQNFVEKRDYPLQQLGIRQSALSQSPYGSTSASTMPGAQPNYLGSALGGALTGASLFGTGGALAGAMGLGAGGGALLGAGLGLLL